MDRHVFGAFNAFRSDFERPCQNEGHGKSKDKKKDHPADRPARNLEERKDLRDNLDQHPADDGIGDGNAINVPPLQFAQEPAPVHPPTFVVRSSRVSELYDLRRAGPNSIRWNVLRAKRSSSRASALAAARLFLDGAAEFSQVLAKGVGRINRVFREVFSEE